MAASMKPGLSKCFQGICSLHKYSGSRLLNSNGTLLPRAVCRRLTSTTAADNVNEKSSLADAFRQAKVQQNPDTRNIFRTSENDASQHSHAHEGLYYTVTPEDYTMYMKHGQHPKFNKIVKAFNECCIMVRKPATEIFQCLAVSNFALPAIRYAIYGPPGVGKSMTLSHVLQHCGKQGWLIVHIPWVEKFVTFPREVQASPWKPERGDTPVDAADWLNYFQGMNKDIISQLTTRNKYTWSRREVMEPGTPLTELIEFALSRSKYAGDVMAAVLKEVKQASNEGLVRTLVAVDGANSLWQRTNVHRAEDRTKKYAPEEMTVVRSIWKLLSNDWSGGAIVLTVDMKCAPLDRQESYLPRYVLTKEAIDHLEPHIPIHVENFDNKEAASCLEYFIDRKWIQREEGLTEQGQREILFLSSNNPSEMYKICSRW